MRKTQARLVQESKFKPKRIILNGVAYNVDSLDKLDKIKEELRAKKEYEDDLREEQKNQKVLITKTRIGNTDQRVTKVITDISMLPDRNKRVVKPQVVREPEKPKFTLKMNPGRRLVKPSANSMIDNNLTTSSPFNDTASHNTDNRSNKEIPFETIYRGPEDYCNLGQCNPMTSSTLTVKSHPRKEIKKLKTRDELGTNSFLNDDGEQGVVLINQSNAYCADFVNGHESAAPKFQIKTHDRKPIPKDGLISQEESYKMRFGAENNNDENNDITTENMEEKNMDDEPIKLKPKISVVTRTNRIRQLNKRNAEVENNENDMNDESKNNNVAETKIENTNNGVNKEESDEKPKMKVVSNANRNKQLTKRVVEPKPEENKEFENNDDNKQNDKNEREKIEDTFVNLALNSTVVKKESPTKPDRKSPKQETVKVKVNEIKEISENDGVINGFFNEQYQVLKSEWYILAIKSRGNNEGLIKILDDTKSQMMPSLKINNDMFIYRKYDNKINEYRIYVKTLRNSTKADVYIVGLDIMNVKFQQVSFNIVQKNVELWKMRKLYDLEFINYYLSNLKFDCSEKFIESFNADYKLFKNPDLFDNFIGNLKLDLTKLPRDEEFYNNGKINVLYLVQSSIEYEQCGYTIRSQNLLKNADDKYNMICVTKYGYPYDKEQGYFENVPEETTIHDGITYFKLLNSNDNFNSNNIIDYIKKYIVNVIKLAVKTNAKLIHGVDNYLNGLAAMYASKFLGIKSIYEIRGFWDEYLVISKSELKGSNLIKMMTDQEHKVIRNVDLVVTNNQILEDKILGILNEKEKEKLKIISDTVDTERFKPDENKRKELRDKYSIGDSDIIIGYIGSITNYQGIEYILECLKLLLAENKSVKFVMIGSGPHEEYITDYINELELENHVINLGKIDYGIIHEYYNMIDIMAYPKKSYDWCKHTSSYKVMEAMSMEKAIVMSNFMKQEGVISIEPENLNDLFEKIKMLIAEPEKRDNYGKKARQWILENKKNSKIDLDKLLEQ